MTTCILCHSQFRAPLPMLMTHSLIDVENTLLFWCDTCNNQVVEVLRKSKEDSN